MKNNYVKGKPLRNNIFIDNWYKQQLLLLTDKITKKYTQEITKIYKEYKQEIQIKVDNEIKISQDDSISSQMRIKLNELKNKYDILYRKKSKIIIKQMLKKQLKYSIFTFNNMFQKMTNKDFTIKVDYINDNMKEKVKAMIYDNVNLIKSIHSRYFEEIQGAVMRSINEGQGLDWLSEQLTKYNDITKRRARNIAKDQSKKIYTNIQLNNMQTCGIKYFKWIHSGAGKKPREYHKKDYSNGGLNNGIFSIENPPIIDKKTGQKGFPGDLPFCRCVMVPVIQYE